MADYITSGHAARILGVSIPTLKRWVTIQLLPEPIVIDGGAPVPQGDTLAWDRAAVEALAAERKRVGR